MTGIIIEARPRLAAPHPDFGRELEPAFSPDTKRLVREVMALRTGVSPTATHQGQSSEKGLSERLFDALVNAKVLASTVAMHLDREWRDRLFRQLDSLHDVNEWEEGDEPMQQSSFATFLKAMLTVSPQRRPGLGLSQDGHLIAAWTSGRDRLTIEFLPNDRVKWVLARYRDDEPSRFAGQTPVDELLEGLAPHQPQRWFSDEGWERP